MFSECNWLKNYIELKSNYVFLNHLCILHSSHCCTVYLNQKRETRTAVLRKKYNCTVHCAQAMRNNLRNGGKNDNNNNNM